MGRLFESLTPDLISWIERQHLFFTATAPGAGGHVNCSPKGLDTLRILDPFTVVQHFLPLEPPFLASARSIVQINIERIADSCGYGVPVMRYEGERRQLAEWTDNRLRKHGPDAIRQYQLEKNTVSIDHLPALDPTPQEIDGAASLTMSTDSPQQSRQSHPGTPDVDP